MNSIRVSPEHRQEHINHNPYQQKSIEEFSAVDSDVQNLVPRSLGSLVAAEAIQSTALPESSEDFWGYEPHEHIDSAATDQTEAHSRPRAEKKTSAFLKKSKDVGRSVFRALKLRGELMLQDESSLSFSDIAGEESKKNEKDAEEAGLTFDPEVVASIESRGYVSEAPIFSEQVAETDRTNPFEYQPSTEALWSSDPNKELVEETTEHEGLKSLQAFLTGFIEAHDGEQQGSTKSVYVEKAKSMLENMTFIGEKEYTEAARGLADLWKSYLSESSDSRICVLSSISATQGYGKRKSDAHLFERVMDNFTDEELEQVEGRILTSLDDIGPEDTNTKIIMLDDWTISGQQMRGAYNSMRRSGQINDELLANVEIHLIASSGQRIEDGLLVSSGLNGQDHYIPVRAYYKSHKAPTASHEHKGHVTGTHSSVDYDFEIDIDAMLSIIRSEDPSTDAKMPPLTNIVRTYRYAEPRYEVNKSKISRKRRV